MRAKSGKESLIGAKKIENKLNDGAFEQAKSGENNKKKSYILSGNEEFLKKLGVSDENGRIRDKMQSKLRQINKFIEHIDEVKDKLPSDSINIYDLCCGKSYLSFAVYHYFKNVLKVSFNMICVDLKKDVIEYCSGVATRLNYEGLNFVAGDIRDFPIRRTPDLTVSLHACDIATDIVIAKGIDSESKVILSTPCCHHEMMHQMKPNNGPMDFLLEHSILKQKFADAATDALRCKILEIKGYDVNAIELIDPEETPKNVIIRAVKKNRTDKAAVEKNINEYRAICEMLGINPYLWQNYFGQN
jgi:SAM-dependent methyltransferase